MNHLSLGALVLVLLTLFAYSCKTKKIDDGPNSLKEGNMEMVLVKGGTFQMGDRNAIPIHEVTIQNFYMGKYEVTVAQYEEFVSASGYITETEKKGRSYIMDEGAWEEKEGINWRHDATGKLIDPKDYNHPVVHVTWADGSAYCKWLAEKTGKPYRLPSEAEWEYAAGNGEAHTAYPWGEQPHFEGVATNISDASRKDHMSKKSWGFAANFNDGYVYTSPVGKFPPNQLGLYDLAGNVYEWCEDTWHYDYEGAPSDGSAWVEGRHQDRRVMRGGSWLNLATDCSTTKRSWIFADRSIGNYGFRVARDMI